MAKNISWLSLLGGLIALAMAVVYFGGLAVLIDAIPLYIIMGFGIALMVYDLFVSTGELADKREAARDRKSTV
jgi:hypothetical protein